MNLADMRVRSPYDFLEYMQYAHIADKQRSNLFTIVCIDIIFDKKV